MPGGEANVAGLFAGSQPDGSCASDEGEGITADEVGGTFEGEVNGIVCVGADVAEFVGDPEDYAGGVGSVGNEGSVVGQDDELARSAPLLERSFRDDLLAFLEEAVDAEVSPAVALFGPELATVEDKGWISEVIELGAVGVEFSDEVPGCCRVAFVAHIELEVITVRADDGLGEAGGFVGVGPVEGWLEDDLFGGIALRFVEAGSGLGLAEDVSDAVVADTVAGAEVSVGVVVEGAPRRCRRRTGGRRLSGCGCGRGGGCARADARRRRWSWWGRCGRRTRC